MLARAASASPKTIYARYGGKLGLFEAVIERLVAQPIAVWDDLNPTQPPDTVLVSAADRFLAVVLAPEVLAIERAIIAEAPRLPALARRFYARGPRRGLEVLATYFAALNACGTLQIDHPSSAAEAFIGLIEGELARRALFLGEEPSDDARRQWAAYAVGIFIAAHRGKP